MHGTQIITKHGLHNHMVFHQNQDIIVTTTAENVVTLLYQIVLHLQYLKCGAEVHQETAGVVVCKACQQTQAVMLLSLLTYQVVIRLQFVQDAQVVVCMLVITTQERIVL
jgi:hypothetical protein